MPILFVNRLTVIDASLLHPELGLLGESWLVDIELEGALDEQGMVLDFAEVKKQVKQIIDDRFDHRLLIPGEYHRCHVEQSEQACEVRFQTRSGEEILLRAPASSIRTIAAERVGTESLTAAITETLQPLLPANVRRVGLHLHREQIDGAWYRYSHGLKQHAGNCQRITHGHRSRLHIIENGQRNRTLEQQWADRWRDIYLASRSDLRETFSRDGIEYCRFGYSASQGVFELTLPRSRCRLLEGDTTVENLAQYIADTLHREHPGSSFRVLAFEGVDKGAVGEALNDRTPGAALALPHSPDPRGRPPGR
jgi:6-pyruvoyl-tetrahydropterin synthase